MRRDSFNPTFWGPITWKVLFIFVLNYPVVKPSNSVKHYYSLFFESLQSVLPCQKCRKSYKLFLSSYPIKNSLKSNVDLLKWVTRLYNDKRPEKSQIKSVDDVLALLNPDQTINLVLDGIKRKIRNSKLI